MSSLFRSPRCVARFEYIGDQKDELSFSEGEIITLKEYVNEEWARGELQDRTGIFPLNFVELIEDHPTSGANVLSEYRKYFFVFFHTLIQISNDSLCSLRCVTVHIFHIFLVA